MAWVKDFKVKKESKSAPLADDSIYSTWSGFLNRKWYTNTSISPKNSKKNDDTIDKILAEIIKAAKQNVLILIISLIFGTSITFVSIVYGDQIKSWWYGSSATDIVVSSAPTGEPVLDTLNHFANVSTDSLEPFIQSAHQMHVQPDSTSNITTKNLNRSSVEKSSLVAAVQKSGNVEQIAGSTKKAYSKFGVRPSLRNEVFWESNKYSDGSYITLKNPENDLTALVKVINPMSKETYANGLLSEGALIRLGLEPDGRFEIL